MTDDDANESDEPRVDGVRSARTRDLRAREAMIVLAERVGVDAPMLGREVVREVMTRIPPVGDEAVRDARDRLKADVDLRWSTVMLTTIGWLFKAHDGSGWRLTAEGRRALDDFPEASVFVGEARSRYRSRPADDSREALRARILPVDDAARWVVEAATLFTERGLRAGGSVFVPERRVWTAPVVAEVAERFIDADGGAGSFLDRLRTQLRGASDDAILLTAELVAWQLLPLSHHVLGEIRKQERIETILGWASEGVAIPIEVRTALVGGSFNPGTRMATDLPGAVTILVHLLERWTALTASERDRILDEPLAWRDLVAAAAGAPFPSQRGALAYLARPDFFTPIVSAEHKQRIRAAFLSELDDTSGDIDVDLFEITTALQERFERAADYYSEPLRSQWRGEPLPPVDPPSEVALHPATEQLAARLHLDRSWLDSTIALLGRRSQLIFYGPPGTGKTYVARALAEHVASPDRVEVVQFHPSYSYEDFFEGYRPVIDDLGSVGFRLRPGPLRRIVARAERNPELPYVLIIDEINRANLSKVFGELYYLLEYRDQEISLLYSEPGAEGAERRFRLPKNLFFIGTMNTSDRSIALLDAAMRRRFAFRELHPQRPPVDAVLASWSRTHAQRTPLIEELPRLLDALNRRIDDDAYKIGPSYLMSVRDDDDLLTVWESQILPLLAELHYGDEIDLESRYGVAALRRDGRDVAPGVADDPLG